MRQMRDAFKPTLDHAVRTPLTTIIGLSEILQTELFGPLGSRRYKEYAADIVASAGALQELIHKVEGSTARTASRGLSYGHGREAVPASSAPAAAPVSEARRWEDLGDLIARAFEAGIDADKWPRLLKGLRLALNADCAALVVHEHSSHPGRIWHVAGSGIDPEVNRLRHQAVLGENILKDRVLMAPGTVWTDEVIVSAKALQPSPQRPSGGLSHFVRCACGVVERTGPEVICVSLIRARNAGPFSREEIGLLETLMPYLRRSIRIHRKMSDEKREREALADTLDRFPLAVALVDAAGRVFSCNRRARGLFAAADGLVLKRDGLHASTARETALLQGAVTGAIGAARQQLRGGGNSALAISRPSGRRDLCVLVLPALASQRPMGKSSPVAVVFVADPEQKNKANESDLRYFWQLTRNEARVAAKLAEGTTVESVAKSMGITTNTVRTHLKHVFNKTWTENQVELVHLVLKTPACIRRD